MTTTTTTTTTTLPGLATGTWKGDAAHTEIGFTAHHLMVTKVRGKFTDFDITVEVADNLADSVATAVIQTASVDTGSADRDAHLRSGDFFEAEEFPAISFRSTAFTGSTLTGDLTIKGVTKPVTLDVEFGGVTSDPWGNTKAGFEASTEINRTDWGLNWNAALETGGVLVSEKIRITVDLQLLKA